MGWKRTLRRMLTDARPTSYSYDEVASVLSALGFSVAPHGGTSHRKWRAITTTGQVVLIGLVDAGHGTMKPYLVREEIRQIRDHDMIPDEFKTEDA